eukprot:GGOE01007554.1.p1 GENE.GGOE01007554.1~~GGOE01007554.1.p1  ORF type:complete len:352 (+),score=91.81 GGOE01007554.1:68-1123(+)
MELVAPGDSIREQKYAWDISVLQQRLRHLEEEHEKLMRERSNKISELTDKCDELKLELVMSSPLKSLSLDDLKAESDWHGRGEEGELRRQNSALQQEVAALRQHNEQLAGDKAALIAALRRYGYPLPANWSSHAESSSSSSSGGGEHRPKCKCTATHKRCHRGGVVTQRGGRTEAEATSFMPMSSEICTDHENLSAGSNNSPSLLYVAATAKPDAPLTLPRLFGGLRTGEGLGIGRPSPSAAEDDPSNTANGGSHRRRLQPVADKMLDDVASDGGPRSGHGGHEGPSSPNGSQKDVVPPATIGSRAADVDASGWDPSDTIAAVLAGKRPATRIVEADVARLEYPLKRLKLA